MSQLDECQRCADTCRKLAAQTVIDADRIKWLTMAQYWTQRAREASANEPKQPELRNLLVQLGDLIAKEH